MEDAKKVFNQLKVDPQSVAFAEELLNKRLLVRLKKSKYPKDKLFFKIVNDLDREKSVIFNPETVNRTDYVEKRDIDRSTLYSFSRPLELLHADVANLEFLGKNATFPQYVLLVVDLFSSKTYTYPMRSRRQIRDRLEQFYLDVQGKRKGRRARLQVDKEFQQLKIKDLNKKFNVEMYSTSLRGGKAFAAKQKIRELKKRVAQLQMQKLKITPKRIIEISTQNMNVTPSVKYGVAPERIEQEALKSERFRILFNMRRLEKTEKLHGRLERYDEKVYQRKRKKLREKLNVGERVYVLAERIRKKSAPGKFYKQTVQNISYFNKETVYLIRQRKKVNNIYFYWLNNLKNRFVRSELFALKENFS